MPRSPFEALAETWTKLGEIDPMWAILSSPAKENRRWDRDEFFATGRAEVGSFLGRLASLGLTFGRGAVLDFGCGLGRNTQAFAAHFDEAHGVDVAQTMIEQARAFLPPAVTNVRFHLNQRADLGLFDSNRFDLVYSYIVLQHIPPEIALGYIAEFVRVARPGGLVAFQVPERLDEAQKLDYRAAISLGPVPRRCRPGETLEIRVRVVNTGTAPWNAEPLRIYRAGNHWYDASGAMIVRDDGRVTIGDGVAPGGSFEGVLQVRAPPLPGRYLLGVDVVREGVLWFEDAGSAVAKAPVEVGRDGWARRLISLARVFERRRRPPPPPVAKPAFEMHGIPRTDVVRAIEQAGGKVVCVDTDMSAGVSWRSHFYFARK